MEQIKNENTNKIVDLALICNSNAEVLAGVNIDEIRKHVLSPDSMDSLSEDTELFKSERQKYFDYFSNNPRIISYSFDGVNSTGLDTNKGNVLASNNNIPYVSANLA